jgi:uncharacterized metal-binding protein
MGNPDTTAAGTSATHELVRIERTKNACGVCEAYAKRNAAKEIAVLCCEGACLRGEVARQAANELCHRLAPERTVRICLGGAFTKDTGQRALVRNAAKVVALEGCFLNCASRTMRGVLEDLEPQVVVADRLYEFDRTLFGVDQMAPEEITRHARTVAKAVLDSL